jgi:Type IV secretion system pilin
MYKIINLSVSAMMARLALFIFILMSFLAFQSVAVHAADIDSKGNLCDGASLSLSGDGEDCGDSDATNVDNAIQAGINLFSVVVGIIAVIMIIIGGFKYITSGGDSGKIGSAKSTIIYALVGLVIVALAQVIVRFVIVKTASE